LVCLTGVILVAPLLACENADLHRPPGPSEADETTSDLWDIPDDDHADDGRDGGRDDGGDDGRDADGILPGGDGGDEGDDGGGHPDSPPLYPGDRVHSPINAFVRDNLGSIRGLAPDAPADVFMKIGASSTVSQHTLHCFANGPVALDVHQATLGASLEFYLQGQAAGTTPFNRVTLAAQSGRTAGWAISGSPSPIAQEIAALGPAGPSLGLVHYGANDMGMGLTYASALPGYFANMSDLLDLLIDQGVVPIVFGISRRLDNASADLWVQSYNAVARALAQARALPFVDLRYALEHLPGYGLAGDGLHLESFAGGACILTPEGLGHGYNIRNLIGLEALDRLHTALVDQAPVDGEPAPILFGEGTLDSPLEIPGLPFADSRSTVDAPSLVFDEYYGCESMADESGPENIYRMVLDQTTPIRAIVLDRAGVDIDIHLLDDTATEAGCIARADTRIERTLEPGTYYFSLDTYVNGQGVELSGDYTFVVLACEPQDTDCLL